MITDKITLSEKEIEIIGELDPEFKANISYAPAGDNLGISLVVEISCLPNLKDIASLFAWGVKHDIGQWEGKWRLRLERID